MIQLSAGSAFDRLRTLLHKVSPSKDFLEVRMHIGECQLAGEMTIPSADLSWRKYPPLGGTETLHEAYGQWLERRFEIDPYTSELDLRWEPTPGTKQAVYVAILNVLRRARRRGIAQPKILQPNPGYPTYLAALEYGDGLSIFYEDVMACTSSTCVDDIAALILCHPDNPTGRVYCRKELRTLCDWAHQNNVTLIVDECYIDLYVNHPPPGFISCVNSKEFLGLSFLVLHSLSKRSSMPGLRHGFVLGDRKSVEDYARFNRSCGVSVGHAVCASAAAFWSDDDHVEIARKNLSVNLRLAQQYLGNYEHFEAPEAGLFLWLNVSNGEEFTRQLWRDGRVMVMPGKYLAEEYPRGTNPGNAFIRISLGLKQDEFRQGIFQVRRLLMNEKISKDVVNVRQP